MKTHDDRRQVTLIYLGFSGAVCLGFSFLCICFGLFVPASLLLTGACLFGFLALLLRQGHLALVKLAGLFTSLGLVLLLGLLFFPQEAGLQYQLLPLLAVSILLFDGSVVRYRIFLGCFALMILVSFVAIFISGGWILPWYAFSFLPLQILYACAISASVIGLFVIMIIFSIELGQVKGNLLYLNSTDALTGLLNRRAFIHQADTAFAAFSQRQLDTLFVVMIDVDNFKMINDSLGHLFGDQVLIRVAECIKRTLRKTDISARYGGDEFAVILPEITESDALSLANKLVRAVAISEIHSAGWTSRISISVGVGQADQLDGSLESVLSRADTALYRVKESGKNGVQLG